MSSLKFDNYLLTQIDWSIPIRVLSSSLGRAANYCVHAKDERNMTDQREIYGSKETAEQSAHQIRFDKF